MSTACKPLPHSLSKCCMMPGWAQAVKSWVQHRVWRAILAWKFNQTRPHSNIQFMKTQQLRAVPLWESTWRQWRPWSPWFSFSKMPYLNILIPPLCENLASTFSECPLGGGSAPLEKTQLKMTLAVSRSRGGRRKRFSIFDYIFQLLNWTGKIGVKTAALADIIVEYWEQFWGNVFCSVYTILF